MEKAADLPHNKNNCTNAFPQDDHCTQYSTEIPISSHGILKIHVFKGQVFVEWIIFTAYPRIYLSETGILFFVTVAVKECRDFNHSWEPATVLIFAKAPAVLSFIAFAPSLQMSLQWKRQ